MITKFEREWMNTVPYEFINEEVNRIVFLEWIEEFNIERMYTGLPLWPKMHGRKFQRIAELSDFEKIPYSRQEEMYERYDGSRVLVVHFYEDISPEDIGLELDEFTDIRGLSSYWLAYDESWYNPGVSLTALLEIYDLDRYLSYINRNRKYDGKYNRHWI